MIPKSVRIFLCLEPMDMRRSFDGLALATERIMQEDPLSGGLFVFVNKRANRLKAIWWDSNGYCMLYKRLHGASFVVEAPDSSERSIQLDGARLASLLRGVPKRRRRR